MSNYKHPNSNLDHSWRYPHKPTPDPFVLTTESPFRTTVGDFPYAPGTGQPAPQDDPQAPAPSPVAQGWQCPKCQRIHSPTVLMCDYCTMGGGVVSSSASTNGTFTTEMP